MAIRNSTHWAFYTYDEAEVYTLVSDKVCKYPTWTKNFKEVAKLLSNKKVKGAGCMTYNDFPHLTISRFEVIQKLKDKFFSNDPASWGEHSDTVLLDWYKEHILEDKNSRIKIK